MMIKRTTLAMMTVAILSACGGSSDSTGTANNGDSGRVDGGSPPVPAAIPENGVFIDSAVAGISYATATQSGDTDAQGRFKYLPGETVTFSIGGIQLPVVAASGTLTPLMLFQTSDFTDQRVVNLGRLLQSLDDDGDLDNGIQITQQARTAATGLTLDFAIPVATFEANAGVINLLASGGGSATLVAAEDAIDHMRDQAAQNDLSLVGSWYLHDDEALVTVTFLPDGKYIIAEDAIADEAGKAGVEYGTYAWSPASGELAAQPLVDSNGEWGFSHPQGKYVVTRDGDTIAVTETNGAVGEGSTLNRVADPDNAIVGTWTVDGHPAGKMSVFVFLPDGHFTLAESGTADEDGGPGIEHGTYAWDAETTAFAVGQMLANTNGQWGISHQALQAVAVQGNSMTATLEGNDIASMTRVQ